MSDDYENDHLVTELEEILCEVPSDFFDEHNFNPFKHWKEDPQYLVNLKANLERAVEKIVELKYKGFNRSSTSFSTILQKFMAAQNLLVTTQNVMQRSKRLLAGNAQQQNLANLYYQSMVHKKTLELLDKMDFLLGVPKQLDVFVNNRQYLHAVHLLIGSLALMASAEMNGIEALQDLHDELLARRNILQDILIEELNTVIYLHAAVDESANDSSLVTRPLNEISNSNPDYLLVGTEHTISIQFPSFLPPPTVVNDESSQSSLFDLEIRAEYIAAPKQSEFYVNILVHALDRLDRLASAEAALARRVKEELKKLLVSEIRGFKSKVDRKEKNLSMSTLGFLSASSEVLGELMDCIFESFTRVQQNHLNVIALFCSYMGKTSLPHYTAEALWNSMQSELSDMLLDYFSVQKKQAKMGVAAVKSAAVFSISKPLLLNFSFSFEESQIPSLAQLARAKKKEIAVEQTEVLERTPLKIASYFVAPSPYNIVSLYRRIVQFIDQSQSMMGLTSSNSQLRSFMNEFVQNVLLPRVHADSHIRVQDIVSSPAAFKPSELPRLQEDVDVKIDDNASHRNTGGVPVLRASIEICELIRHLFVDMFQLPTFVSAFVTVIEYVLSMFLEKCNEKLSEITNQTYVGAQLSNPAIFSQMQNDPLYQLMRLETRVPDAKTMETYFYEHEWQIYQALFSNQVVLERSQLILDSHRWSLLAIIAESAEFMNDRIRALADPSSLKDESFSLQKNSSTKRVRPSHFKTETKPRNQGNTTAAAKKIATIFGPNQDFMAGHFIQLADTCIFTLRMELSVHCFFFLNSIRSENYWQSEESMAPEPFILDLNADLTLAEEKLSGFLTTDKIRYLFGSMGYLMSSIIVNLLPQLINPRVNRNGVSQMVRNLFALQQNLTNIIVSQDSSFDRARQYWEMLNLNEEETIAKYQEAKSKEHQKIPHPFTANEIRALFLIHSPLRKAYTDK